MNNSLCVCVCQSISCRSVCVTADEK